MRAVGVFAGEPGAPPFAGAILERVDGLTLVLSRERRDAHHREVTACARAGLFAPLRGMDDDAPDTLANRLRAARGAFEAAFARLEGQVEIAVRLASAAEADAADAGPASSGRTFLLNRKAVAERQRVRLDELDRATAEILRLAQARGFLASSRRSQGPTRHVAILAPRIEAAGMAAVIARLDTADLRVDVSGPWPGYSFSPSLTEARPC